MAARTAGTRRGLLGVGAAAALAAAAFVGLGVWQLERRAWKHDLVARVEARLAAAPAPAPGREDWSAVGRDDEYRRVTLAGAFRSASETLVQAVTELGPGSWVMTPFTTSAGDTVLVNRGFVPPERRDAATRSEPRDGKVVGLLRLAEPGGAFLRSNDPVADRWYSRDVAAIAAARGLGDVAPFFIDADGRPNPGGFPVGGLTVVAFRDQHLVYALTWFGLALTVAGAAAWAIRRELAGPPGPNAAQDTGR